MQNNLCPRCQSPIPADDKPALNKLLQELAWDAVIHHPLSGVTGA